MGVCMDLSNDPNKLSFHSSYKKLDEILITILETVIDYIKYCSVDQNYQKLYFLDFLHDFEKNQSKLLLFDHTNKKGFLIEILKKNVDLLDKLELSAIYYFINVLNLHENKVSYQNSLKIMSFINKINDFIQENEIKKDVIKLKNLFEVSFYNKQDICIR